METRLVEYNGVTIRVPKGRTTEDFIYSIQEDDITYSWFADAVDNAIECSEEGDLRQLETELARIEVLGRYHKLRGIDEFIQYCAGQAVGICVKRDTNSDLLKEFSDRYKLFIIGSRG